MQKISILFLCVMFFKIGLGQTVEKNLKLVNFISIDASGAYNDTIRFVVPAGKIWKIENFFANRSDSSASNFVLINRIKIIDLYSSKYLSYSPGVPVWLHTGDEIQFIGINKVKFSGFEFVIE